MTSASQDRSTELYEGLIGTPDEQRQLAARMHWMVAHAEGQDVLDIGCGQGVASLLLAREGRHVVGIDRDAEILEWARRRAEREPPPVRRRLTYQSAEAADLPFENDSFDTVVVGGVLEEHIDPGPVILEALRVLRIGGRLVITSRYAEVRSPPFGEPLYLKGLIALLSGSVNIDDIAMLGEYVALTGQAVAERVAEPSRAVLMEALTVAERHLAMALESAPGSRAEPTPPLEAPHATEQAAEAEDHVVELEADLAGHSARVARLEARLEALQANAASEAMAEERRSEAAARVAELEQEVATLRATVAQASERLVTLEAERRTLAQVAADVAAEAARLEDSLAGERSAAREARREAAGRLAEAAQAQADAAELTAAVERLTAKVGAGAERIAVLEQATAAAEADRRRLDQRWRHATDRAERLEQELIAARSAPPELPLVATDGHAPPELARADPAPVLPALASAAGEPPPVPHVRRPRTSPRPTIRVLHLIARSVPHDPSPITLDRHGLIIAQRRAGLDSSAMTALGFPWDAGVSDPGSCELVDGVAYYRLHDPGQPGEADRLSYATTVAEELLDIVEPQVLHAAGVDSAPLALALAERHSLRCVVELAGESTPLEELDPELLATADHVVALNEDQREQAIRSGVPAERVEVIPAFVDTTRFGAPRRARNSRRAPVVGTVSYGSGPSASADAVHEVIAAAKAPVRGLIVRVQGGAGASTDGWELDIAEGTVTERTASAAEAPHWLAQIDLVIAATPHEALDAMAAARAVVGVGAATAVAPDLGELSSLLANGRLRAARGRSARRLIEANNTVSALQAYARLYA